jgi:poly-gamma-glutamate synthesis protein (capsule biosynthesis protein)
MGKQPWASRSNQLRSAKAARADHDLLVVLVHWGDEQSEKPGARQRRIAHALIDGGVDLVIGHHPHVLQAVEHYQGGLIAYSRATSSSGETACRA